MPLADRLAVARTCRRLSIDLADIDAAAREVERSMGFRPTHLSVVEGAGGTPAYTLFRDDQTFVGELLEDAMGEDRSASRPVAGGLRTGLNVTIATLLVSFVGGLTEAQQSGFVIVLAAGFAYIGKWLRVLDARYRPDGMAGLAAAVGKNLACIALPAVLALALPLSACAFRAGPVALAIGAAGVRDCEGYQARYDPETGGWVSEGCEGRLQDVYGGEASEQAVRAVGGLRDTAIGALGGRPPR